MCTFVHIGLKNLLQKPIAAILLYLNDPFFNKISSSGTNDKMITFFDVPPFSLPAGDFFPA